MRYPGGKTWKKIATCMGLFFLTPILSGMLFHLVQVREQPSLEQNREQFREMKVAAERLEGYGDWGEGDYERLARDYMYHQGEIKKEDESVPVFSWYGILAPHDTIKEYARTFQSILADIKCFPVDRANKGRENVYFQDSWGNSRSYGGKRVHEGTDIMTTNNVRGYFPIVSVSDGVVEKRGWLPLGGYRIGVRSPKGTYFYYAHLERYEKDTEEGSRVKAGQILGYMGDSGYGPEGTVGKFDVHLHFGIYTKIAGKEVSINPYEILRLLEESY